MISSPGRLRWTAVSRRSFFWPSSSFCSSLRWRRRRGAGRGVRDHLKVSRCLPPAGGPRRFATRFGNNRNMAVASAHAGSDGRGPRRLACVARRCPICDLWLILRRVSGCGLLATLGIIVAVIPLIIHGVKQSEVDVGLLFFVVLMSMTTTPRIPWWTALIGLPALFALWANAHASAVVGLAWLGVVAIGRAIEWWKQCSLSSASFVERPAVGRLLIAIVLCMAATCLNPDGPRIFIEAFRAAKNPSVGTLPGWQPIDFSKSAGMPWIYFGSIAAILLVQLISRTLVVAIGIDCDRDFRRLATRSTTWGGLLVADRSWLLFRKLAAIAAIGDGLRSLKRQAKASNVTFACASGSDHRRRWIIAIVCGVAILATPAARWFISGSPRSLESIVSRDTPARLALELTADEQNAGNNLPELREQIRATYPNGKYRGALLCGEDQGDFLAWVLDGDNNRPVMIYNRPLAFDPDHWSECQTALDGESSWWEITGPATSQPDRN